MTPAEILAYLEEAQTNARREPDGHSAWKSLSGDIDQLIKQLKKGA